MQRDTGEGWHHQAAKPTEARQRGTTLRVANQQSWTFFRRMHWPAQQQLKGINSFWVLGCWALGSWSLRLFTLIIKDILWQTHILRQNTENSRLLVCVSIFSFRRCLFFIVLSYRCSRPIVLLSQDSRRLKFIWYWQIRSICVVSGALCGLMLFCDNKWFYCVDAKHKLNQFSKYMSQNTCRSQYVRKSNV